MYLSAVVEWCVEIILPLKVVLWTIPILYIILAVLAVRCELIANLRLAIWRVVELVVRRGVYIPVVFALVASCTLVAFTRKLKHITLGVLQRIPIVAETTRQSEFIASLVYLPHIVGGNLCKLLFV